MNFTLDELIDRIKYHGHTYGLSTIEILEGLARQVEQANEDLETIHEKEKNEAIIEALEERKDDNIEKIDRFVDEFCGDIDSPENEKLKEFWLGIVEILESHRD